MKKTFSSIALAIVMQFSNTPLLASETIEIIFESIESFDDASYLPDENREMAFSITLNENNVLKIYREMDGIKNKISLHDFSKKISVSKNNEFNIKILGNDRWGDSHRCKGEATHQKNDLGRKILICRGYDMGGYYLNYQVKLQ